MMSDLGTLRELIRTQAMVALEDNIYGKKMVTLKEPEPKDSRHSGYSVTISGMPKDAVVIKADAFPSPKTVFNSNKGQCKRADFVIIANTDKGNWIICIEMKKGKGDSEQEIIWQLKGAQCLIAYCRAIGQAFWQRSEFLEPDAYEYRFVSIRDIGINKKTTRIPPLTGTHDCPERMLKISAPHHLQFKQLTGAM